MVLRHCRRGTFGEGLIHLDDGVEVVNVKEGIAVGPRHARVDLGDAQPRRPRCRQRAVDRHAE